MANLIVLTGLRRGQVFPVEPGALIGRDPKAEVSLPDLLVSTQHARVQRSSAGWQLEDLTSTNGTYQNGRRVVGTVSLAIGDILHVGSTELVFTSRESLADDAPTGLNEVLASSEPSAAFDVRLVADTDAELVLAPSRPIGITGVLPVVRAVGRSLAEAADLPTVLERTGEHFLRAVSGETVTVLLTPPEGGVPRPAYRARSTDLGLERLPLDDDPPHLSDLVGRTIGGRGALLGRTPRSVRGGPGLAYCVALPAAGGVIGAVLVDDVREDLTRQDLRPLFLVANLAGVHCRSHQLLGALRDRNTRLQAANVELEAARSRLSSFNDELQAAVDARTEELARSERGYRELFEESRDGNLTALGDGRLQAINRTAAAILGREPDHCLGRTLAELLGPAVADRLRAAQREATPLFEAPVELPGGAARVLEVLARPIEHISSWSWERQAAGSTGGGVHVLLRDVTARHEAEERMRLLTRIVESMREAVVSTTLDGVVTAWNPGAQALYGFPPGEVLGQTLPTLPDARGAEFERVLAAVAAGQSLQARTERERRDGVRVQVEAAFAPVPDANGQIVGLVEISRDLTEQLRVEERLRWGERMASFGELAAGLAHELGNPLANVRSGLEFLLAREREPQVARESLETLQREVVRLQGLFQHVLDLARWPLPALRPVEVGALLEQVASLVAARAREAKVEVVVTRGEPRELVADRDQLVQALLNLVHNAIEAMPHGGRLELATVDDPAAGTTGFLVRDQGVGIPREVRGKIFDLFFSRRPGGTGIGLAVVKRIVDLHRGQVAVEGEPGAGTTMTVLFPRLPGPGEAPVEAEPRRAAGTEAR